MPAWADNWVHVNGQKQQVLGLSFVLCVAVIWVAASFLVQDLESQGLNPFVLTYIANTLFVVLLPVSVLSKRRKVAATPRHDFLPSELRLCTATRSLTPLAMSQVQLRSPRT